VNSNYAGVMLVVLRFDNVCTWLAFPVVSYIPDLCDLKIDLTWLQFLRTWSWT